jgi:hypothetical protein
MATGTVSSITGDNWQLISSVTPTAAATSVTFSSIAGYKTIMVVLSGIVASATEAMYLQLNGDTTAGDYFGTFPGVLLGRTFTGSAQGRYAMIYDVDKSLPHRVDAPASTSDGTLCMQLWTTASPITSIVCAFTSGATFTAVGTIALYGIAA